MTSQKYDFVVLSQEKGQRLDQYLASQKEIGLTRSRIQKMIEEGWVKVNQEAPKPGYKLKLNDRVAIKIPPPQTLAAKPENIPLKIVYEDGDLIVISKPQGMVVHPAAGNYSGTLVNALFHHCRDLSGIGGKLRPGIVHRLDKDTSGLMVVAKNDFAHLALSKQFSDKEVFKQYLALVHGELKQNQGTIEAKIGRHPKHRKKMAVVSNLATNIKSREAVTKFEVRQRFSGYTLLELTPQTGRTHQLRVHLTSIGHPIVGDQTYGQQKEKFGLAGQFLHAAQLGFTHPRTNKYLEFSAPLPSEMLAVVKKLRRK